MRGHEFKPLKDEQRRSHVLLLNRYGRAIDELQRYCWKWVHTGRSQLFNKGDVTLSGSFYCLDSHTFKPRMITTLTDTVSANYVISHTPCKDVTSPWPAPIRMRHAFARYEKATSELWHLLLSNRARRFTRLNSDVVLGC